ncbi:MAG: alkaline phosphatase D [Hyphomicrobiaceae bacterium]|jgi:alkaline phosphatase D
MCFSLAGPGTCGAALIGFWDRRGFGGGWADWRLNSGYPAVRGLREIWPEAGSGRLENSDLGRRLWVLASANYGLGVRHFLVTVLALVILGASPAAQQPQTAVHMANGIKIGEANHDSARVWVRLTKLLLPNETGAAFTLKKAKEAQLPEGKELGDMQGAVAGAAGEVRVQCNVRGGRQKSGATAWLRVTAATDFAHTFALSALQPGSVYDVLVEGRVGKGHEPCVSVVGQFRTAPAASASVSASFCVITGQDYPRRDDKLLGHLIYREMLKLRPDFLAHTGDTLYYDKAKPFATTVELARFKWNRFYGLQLPREFHRQVATWFIKDDHDTLKDDCWPGQRYGELTFARGLEIYREQLPVGDVPYRRVRWGKHLEVWFLEGREFRSSNRDADGPDKTILGKVQKQWLRTTLAASDATFRIVVSATPIVGPDRKSKRDNHSNKNFEHEGNELRAFLASQPRTFVVCGDRHWQYASQDPATGLREWCSGPTSDQHAGGFRVSDRTDMHSYLKICGGFLHVLVQEHDGKAKLVLRHYDPRGAVTHEDVLEGL